MKKVLSIFLAMILSFSLIGCGTGSGTGSHELKIGQTLYAAHGTKAFALTTVVVEDETIVAAYIDEYQYMSADTTIAVPNSENFSDYVTEGYVLGSKRENNETYSANMAAAGATQELVYSYEAIQYHAIGKTISELKELTTVSPEEAVDAVGGATLVDTQGYISSIILAAEAAQANKIVSTYEGSLDDLTLKVSNGAAHGTKCFTVSAVLTDGETIVAAYIDEFQYLAADQNTGVPNSENFGDYIAEGYVLASKRVNNEAYSQNMAGAGSTQPLSNSYDAIQYYVSGKTIAEVESLSSMTPEEAVDAVSGATLVDTQNYVAELIKTAKN